VAGGVGTSFFVFVFFFFFFLAAAAAAAAGRVSKREERVACEGRDAQAVSGDYERGGA